MSKPFTKMSKFKLVVMITMAVSLCSVNSASSQEPTCCSRAVAVLKTPMPEIQERDDNAWIDGCIGTIFFGSLTSISPSDSGWEDSIFDCPLEIKIRTLDGLNRSIAWSLFEIEGIDQETAESAIQAGFINYVVQPSLTLKRVIEIVPGEWDGAVGKSFYWPSFVKGDWSMRFALIDPHHGTTIKEADTSWTGSALDGEKSLLNLARNLIFDFAL